MLNDDQKNAWVLMSVAGAVIALGNCAASAGFCGPVIVVLAGSPAVFTMPSGGRSGFPNSGVSWCGVVGSSVPMALSFVVFPPAKPSRRGGAYDF